jgi:hypothetical protein
MKPVGYIIWNDEANAPREKIGIFSGANFTTDKSLIDKAVEKLGKGFSVKEIFVETPAETPKKPDVEWCRRQLKAAEAAMAFNDLPGAMRAIGCTVGVLLEMLDPS